MKKAIYIAAVLLLPAIIYTRVVFKMGKLSSTSSQGTSGASEPSTPLSKSIEDDYLLDIFVNKDDASKGPLASTLMITESIKASHANLVVSQGLKRDLNEVSDELHALRRDLNIALTELHSTRDQIDGLKAVMRELYDNKSNEDQTKR